MSEGHVLVDAVEERCVLVGVIAQKTTDAQAMEYIDELMVSLDEVFKDYTLSVFSNEEKVEDVRKAYLLYSEYISYVTDIFPTKKKIRTRRTMST